MEIIAFTVWGIVMVGIVVYAILRWADDKTIERLKELLIIIFRSRF